MSSYHCHRCDKSTVVSLNLGVLTCQRCGSEFVEESKSQVRGVRPDASPQQGRVPQYLFPAPPGSPYQAGTPPQAMVGYPSHPGVLQTGTPPHGYPHTHPGAQAGYPGLSSSSVILVAPPDHHQTNFARSQIHQQPIPVSPQNNPFVHSQPPYPHQPVHNPYMHTHSPQAVSPGTTSPILANLPHTVSYHPGSRVPHHQHPQQPTGPIYPRVGTVPNSPAPGSPSLQHNIPIISPHAVPSPQPQIFPSPPSDSRIGQPPVRDIPTVPTARGIYPVAPRGTDGDDLYGDDTLPDLSFLDLSQTRFKSDRDEAPLAASYISQPPAPAPQPIPTIQTPIQPQPPQETQIVPVQQPSVPSTELALVQPPEQPAADQAAQPAAAAGSSWNIFTGFVDAVRDGLDRLDELTYMIAPDTRTAAHYQLLRLRGGAPPASLATVEGLKTITISGEEMVGQKDCPICCLDWELGESAKLMPCNHCFHEDCLMPWLKERNSCPICRYELPTEDRKYERYKEHRDQHS